MIICLEHLDDLDPMIIQHCYNKTLFKFVKVESFLFISCTVSNEYGSVTASLNINPDVNAMQHRGLKPGTCRATMERNKYKQRQQYQGNELQNGHSTPNGHYVNGDMTLWRKKSSWKSICKLTFLILLKRLSKKK